MTRAFSIYAVLLLAAIALVELLSVGRVKAATFTVTTAADNGDNVNPTPGSFRKAIIDANALAGLDTISFNIPGAGVQSITPLSALPTITDPVIIDGYTQPGSNTNTLAIGGDATLLIELNGTSAGASVTGLTINSGGSTVRGLVINRFNGSGVLLEISGGNAIEGCYIGTNAAGTTNLNNGNVGVYINGTPNNLIGGTTPATRNILSGNAYGVYMVFAGATGNMVQGNYIGLDKSGAVALGNSPGHGVTFDTGPNNNTLGGTAVGAGNVISGNAVYGVLVSAANNNTIQGNLIGTDATGTLDRGNANNGVLLSSSDSNTIGGTAAGARNVISGNDVVGVYFVSSSNNTVQGNYIGTDVNGNADLGNSQIGIRMDSGAHNIIGGTTPAARNVISGNNQWGIRLLGSTGTQILGNFIGTNAAGTAAIGNSIAGIDVNGGATTVTIGGTTGTTPGGACTGACNLISGNLESGISHVNGGATTIQGNFIGTDVNGTADLGNATTGIEIASNATGDTIGGTSPAARNVISGNNNNGVEVGGGGGNTIVGNFIGLNSAGTAALGNSSSGVVITSSGNIVGGTAAGAGNVISGHTSSSSVGVRVGASNNMVQGNFIGTNATGTAAFGNETGIFLTNNSTGALIGGAIPGARNVISGNTTDGIFIGRPSISIGASSSNNTVQGNFIGTTADGAADLGNSGNGVVMRDSASNIIGGSAANERNVISGNNASGVRMDRVFGGTTGNALRGNFIGTNAAGTAALGNSAAGVFIDNSSTNTVGGTAAGQGNVIAFNGGDGVFINSGTGNAIRANSVFNNNELGIDLSPNGVTLNDAGDGDAGPNNLQNFPVITSVSGSGGNITISGSLNSTASTTFTLDFYQSLTADLSGFGEGETYLGSTTTSTDGSSMASFSVTLPASFGGVITATATDPAGNTSEFSQAFNGPTAINLITFTAADYDGGVRLEWQTGYEVDNLGFQLYREEGGKRSHINPQLIAGSALVAGSGVVIRAGQSYAWWDKGIADCRLPIADCRNATYWLEDIDINGKSTMHGPFMVKAIGGAPPARSQAALLSQIGEAQPIITAQATASLQQKPQSKGAPIGQPSWPSLASGPAVKLGVREEGWYRVTQAELVAAGMDARVDPRYLQLYVDGVEQAMLVTGESDGRLDSTDGVEFYGKGLDTPATDTHVYWLIVGKELGKRIDIIASHGKPGGGHSFSYTVERKERSIYFSGLLNGEAENFFGRVVSAQPVDQSLPLQHLDTTSSAAEVEVALQGVTDLATSPDHQVSVALNGVIIGRMVFDGRGHKTERFSVSATLLKEGENRVTLTGQGGSDVTLVDYVRVSYSHTYAADSDELSLTASVENGASQTIEGFSTPLIRVMDVSDPTAVQELAGQIERGKGSGFAVTVDLTGSEPRTLMAFTEGEIKRPATITANQPTNWRSANNGADMLMITGRELAGSLEPLRALRQSQGLSVAVVEVEDIYDEFNFGEKTPQSLKDFIGNAVTSWKKKPRFVLLAGDASFDARNYLGFGDNDLVPTKLIDTVFMETASDEWLADLNNDGLAEVAVGRLPVRTAGEAAKMAAKIVGYERSSPSEEVLLVSDENSGYDFEGASTRLMPLVPANLRIGRIDRGLVDAETAKKTLMEAINRGQKIVNYAGHGSVDLWSGSLLTGSDAGRFENADRLSLFVMMTCLNGYFQEAAMDSLGEALMKAEGGAVGVWTSTGMTMPIDQWTMNEELYRAIFRGTGIKGQSLTIGEAVARAKVTITDSDIRRTWVLLGDPTMKLR